MAHNSLPPPTHNWDAADQFASFDTFRAKAELWLAGEEVKEELQFNKIVLMLGETGLKKWQQFKLSADDRKDPDKVFKKFRESLGNDVSFRTARSTLYRNLQQATDETIHQLDLRLSKLIDDCAFPKEEIKEHIQLDILIHACRYYEVKKWCNGQPEEGENKLTYQKVLTKAKEHEAAVREYLAMSKDTPTLTTGYLQTRQMEVDALQANRTYGKKKQKKRFHNSRSRSRSNSGSRDRQNKPRTTACKNCGFTKHTRPDGACPAKGSTCGFCQKPNHWESVCLKKKRSQQHSDSSHQSRSSDKHHKPYKRSGTPGRNKANIDTVQIATDFHNLQFNSVTTQPRKSSITTHPRKTQLTVDHLTTLDTDREGKTCVMVNLEIQLPHRRGRDRLQVKADMGAEANILPLRTYKQMFPHRINKDGTLQLAHLQQAHLEFKSNEASIIDCPGCITLEVGQPGQKLHNRQFFISPVHNTVLLGHPTCDKLQIYDVNVDNLAPRFDQKKLLPQVDNTEVQATPKSFKTVQELQDAFPDCFDTIGNFKGEYHITVDQNIPPVQHARRKAPIELQEKIKAKLDEMEQLGVITPETEPTAWVNSITYPMKPNGDLRICLDPKDLNKAVLREHYKAPTLDELTHKLTGAKVFSKLDCKTGFWSIKLDNASSRLTTFNTPFGRYRYIRLPFGLKCSQDIFQMRMDQILEGLDGIIAIHDDVTVYGKDEEDHDRALYNLMQTAAKEGLVFNSTKCFIKQPTIAFFGTTFGPDGMSPDPEKIQGILDLPAPTDRTQLQSFLGMVNYMQPFIPHLSHHTTPLRALLQKEAVFDWTASTNAAFQKIKSLLTTASNTHLKYYNRNLPLTVQADASQDGLGAALLQDGKPIAFASKSLTDTERRYANIERELLAVVYACERFHTYLYGRDFTVESDHKPLEMIQKKNLTAAPARLQRMLLRLQHYRLDIKYRPGKEMLLVDALSRLPSKHNRQQIQLDLRIDHHSFTTQRLEQVKMETANDPILAIVHHMTMDGWPETRRAVPRIARAYWDQRDELTTDDGLLLKGTRIIIPASQREKTLNQLHVGHQGMTAMQQNARTTVYWPGIDADISDYVSRCHTCLAAKKSLNKETLVPHQVPQQPWEKIGADFFECNNKKYLAIVDYFSKYPHCIEVRNTDAVHTIHHLENVFSIEGAPDTLFTDNGPPFNSATFAAFAQKWNFNHTTSSPLYPQSNGQVERTVKTLKQIISTCGTNWQQGLLQKRATPIGPGLPSPAELLHGRTVRTLTGKATPVNMDTTNVRNKLIERQDKQEHNFNSRHRAKDLPPLHLQQQVLIQQKDGHWEDATVVAVGPEPRSYTCRTKTNREYRRNRTAIQATGMPDKPRATTETPLTKCSTLPTSPRPQKRVTWSTTARITVDAETAYLVQTQGLDIFASTGQAVPVQPLTPAPDQRAQPLTPAPNQRAQPLHTSPTTPMPDQRAQPPIRPARRKRGRRELLEPYRTRARARRLNSRF